MKFHQIAQGIDVSALRSQIARQPWLWDRNDMRKTWVGTPHRQMSDIWLRYNAWENYSPDDPAAFGAEHDSVWYPAIDALPAAKSIIFDLMARVHGERLGGVLITRIPAGGQIEPHTDAGWHVDYYSSKYYVQLEGAEGQHFWAQSPGSPRESISPLPGDVWEFDNRCLHGVENHSDSERMTLIVCIKRDDRSAS